MPTLREKFRSLIECGILRVIEDVELFSDTESANFGDGVEGGSSLDHLPFDVVGDVISYEMSDICTQCGPLVILIHCVYVRLVLVKPGLHWVIG